MHLAGRVAQGLALPLLSRRVHPELGLVSALEHPPEQAHGRLRRVRADAAAAALQVPQHDAVVERQLGAYEDRSRAQLHGEHVEAAQEPVHFPCQLLHNARPPQVEAAVRPLRDALDPAELLPLERERLPLASDLGVEHSLE